jgi:hypothetical protein
MSRRRALSLLWVLLPLMVARVMLPSGYMPVDGMHGLRLVLCSGVVLPPADDAPQPAGQHAGEFSCPFAQAPAFAPPFEFARVAAAPLVSAAPSPLTPRSAAPSGPPRLDRARGPPLHS